MMSNLVKIFSVLFFLWQLFFGDDWLAFLCRFGVFLTIVVWLVKECTKYKNKQAEAQNSYDQQGQVAKENTKSAVCQAAAMGVAGAALGAMAEAGDGANKDSLQSPEAHTMDTEAGLAAQEDGAWEDGDVEMMDGPYGRAPFGGVIWDDEYSIDELIFKNGVYYYNEHSEEWEEDDEDA